MSVIIQNMGRANKKEHNYDIRINNELIARCKHDRSQGLYRLLRVAASAVDRAQDLRGKGLPWLDDLCCTHCEGQIEDEVKKQP